MRVTVFGATGGIGRHVVERARSAGHELTLFVRDPAPLTELRSTDRVVVGDMTDARPVREAVLGSEAVVNALGPTSNQRHEVERFDSFARLLVATMQDAGVRRLVTLSGAAVQLPAERKRLADRIASAVVRRLAANVVAAKQRELEVLLASDLDWVAVRPPRVVDGAFTGRYRAGNVPIGPRSVITQPDLADFMVRQLTDDSHLRQAPFVTS